VHVAGDQVVASDDFRISQYMLPEPFSGDVLIKARTCVQFSRFTWTQYAITQNYVMFLNADNVLLASRLVEAEYGDINQFMQFEGTEYELPSTLAKRVEQVAVMAKGDHDIEKEVKVYLKNGMAVVRAEKEVGWAEATAKHAGLLVTNDAAFTVNPFFLAEVLRLTENRITLGYDKALFKKDRFTHLISLSLIAEV
jgi:DNA polymerase III sliding clamp (beta) subunit (PCNA family)